jgi:hypothetical protein
MSFLATRNCEVSEKLPAYQATIACDCLLVGILLPSLGSDSNYRKRTAEHVDSCNTNTEV